MARPGPDSAAPLLSPLPVVELMQTAKILGSFSFRYLEPITLVGAFFLAMSLIASALNQQVERWLKRHSGLAR